MGFLDKTHGQDAFNFLRDHNVLVHVELLYFCWIYLASTSMQRRFHYFKFGARHILVALGEYVHVLDQELFQTLLDLKCPSSPIRTIVLDRAWSKTINSKGSSGLSCFRRCLSHASTPCLLSWSGWGEGNQSSRSFFVTHTSFLHS